MISTPYRPLVCVDTVRASRVFSCIYFHPDELPEELVELIKHALVEVLTTTRNNANELVDRLKEVPVLLSAPEDAAELKLELFEALGSILGASVASTNV